MSHGECLFAKTCLHAGWAFKRPCLPPIVSVTEWVSHNMATITWLSIIMNAMHVAHTADVRSLQSPPQGHRLHIGIHIAASAASYGGLATAGAASDGRAPQASIWAKAL